MEAIKCEMIAVNLTNEMIVNRAEQKKRTGEKGSNLNIIVLDADLFLLL